MLILCTANIWWQKIFDDILKVYTHDKRVVYHKNFEFSTSHKWGIKCANILQKYWYLIMEKIMKFEYIF